jgi:VWFA-related protein
MNRKRACLCIVMLSCCFYTIAARDAVVQIKPKADAQENTFKVKTELAEIHAVVTDRQGHVIENLIKEDFELLENNQPQEISFFSVARVEAEPENPAAPDAVRSKPLREQLSEAPARTTVLYVDNLHLDFSRLNWVKQQLHRFINEKMTAQDSIALVTSSCTSGIAQQFTRDRKTLRYAIDQISIGPIAFVRDFNDYLAARITLGDPIALEEGKKILRAQGIDDKWGSMTRARAAMILDEVSYLRETTLVTLKAVIEQMIGMPGQRMVAIFSEGFTQYGRDGWPKYQEVQSAINRAARSGVVVYSIDAKGLDAEAGGGDPYGYATTAEHERQDGLMALAKDTGGEMYMNTNNLGGALSKAFAANRSYYSLAYYLTAHADANRFRSIKVRIRNHPEYTVRTPKGFTPYDMQNAQTPEDEKTPQKRLARAVNAILPTTNLNVSARMDFLESRADGNQVTLTVSFDGDRLQYRKQDQRNVFCVEILYVIYDSSGKQVNSLSTKVEGTLAPEQAAKGRSNGYLFSKRLVLKPGVYQARVGIREEVSDLIGTTTAWIEVPDLARNKLALSNLMLLDPISGGDAAGDQTNADELKPVRMIQGIRLYPRNSVCGYLLRVFRNMKTPIGSDMSLKTELLEGGKDLRQNSWMPLTANKNDMDEKGQIYVGGKVELAGLKPGLYELSISVKDSRLNKTVQRSAIFGIE